MIQAFFVGRLGQDANLRQVQGTDVSNFSVAVDVGYGEKKTTQWIDCAIWGKRANAINQYRRKGQQIAATADISLEEFTRKDGSKGTAMRARIVEIKLVGGKSQDAGAPAETPAPDNSDIPF